MADLPARLPSLLPTRRQVRAHVPFGVRIGLRRAPAILAWARDRRHRLPRSGVSLPEEICARQSPLRRSGTRYDDVLQAGKEQNVRRAAAGLHGVRIDPGQTLSWHREVGPPLQSRGFAPGPELHDDVLTAGVGGGVCQVANLLFWLGVHAGLTVVDRHRHALDLFPDDQRQVPFGLGATVFFPTRDLKLANPHLVSVHVAMRVVDAVLHGAITAAGPLGSTWRVVEVAHRFEEDPEGRVWRINRLDRIRTTADGQSSREDLAEHRARVMYPVPPEAIGPSAAED